jgi:hypothetical protein
MTPRLNTILTIKTTVDEKYIRFLYEFQEMRFTSRSGKHGKHCSILIIITFTGTWCKILVKYKTNYGTVLLLFYHLILLYSTVDSTMFEKSLLSCYDPYEGFKWYGSSIIMLNKFHYRVSSGSNPAYRVPRKLKADRDWPFLSKLKTTSSTCSLPGVYLLSVIRSDYDSWMVTTSILHITV